jgi:DNA-binding PadR family transcriptional regulator
MAAAARGAGEAGQGLFDMFRCAGDLLGQVRRGSSAMSGSHWRGAPWERKPGGRKGPGHWGGGFGGSWGGWWPGPPGPPGAPGAPGPMGGQKAGRGDVRAAILALLREGPRNGYQIMSEIEERSGGAWRPSPGAVYPALSQLADEGLIAGEESAGRRTFSLTQAGREYVEQNPDMARGAWESTAQQEAWQVPGLFAEAARLGGGIVQIAHAGTPEQIHAAERLLEQTRRELYRILAEDTGEPGSREQDV